MSTLFVLIAIGLFAVMAAAWFAQRVTGNAGWVDVFWSFGTALAGAGGALAGEGVAARQWLAAALVLIWGFRLGTHIAARTLHGEEDVRYARFRKDWGAGFEVKIFGFLMIQAVAALPLAFAVTVAAHNPVPGPWLGLGWADLAAAGILAAAIGGEALADRQLRAFRRDLANKGGIADTGLWSWSRHPNYFFQWMGWLGWPVMAIAAGWPASTWPWGWAALAAPLLMYVVLVHLSGIPPTEREMLASRGDAFRAYQARTSAFFPLPPRHQGSAS
ncbi:DUF1295 domain-containing protein [Roseococcus sp.]|uniref:DUF1295 domain-containing protein n=1 Tax=Roseococcus sp. TaxID=2109646 RepID=UPI003BAAB353